MENKVVVASLGRVRVRNTMKVCPGSVFPFASVLFWSLCVSVCVCVPYRSAHVWRGEWMMVEVRAGSLLLADTPQSVYCALAAVAGKLVCVWAILNKLVVALTHTHRLAPISSIKPPPLRSHRRQIAREPRHLFPHSPPQVYIVPVARTLTPWEGTQVRKMQRQRSQLKRAWHVFFFFGDQKWHFNYYKRAGIFHHNFLVSIQSKMMCCIISWNWVVFASFRCELQGVWQKSTSVIISLSLMGACVVMIFMCRRWCALARSNRLFCSISTPLRWVFGEQKNGKWSSSRAVFTATRALFFSAARAAFVNGAQARRL